MSENNKIGVVILAIAVVLVVLIRTAIVYIVIDNIEKYLFGYLEYYDWESEVENPIVTMNIQDYGTVKIELYPQIAPESVANFIALAQNGFYDGLKFHRVVEGFIIQGGDQKGDGTGSPRLSDLGINVSEADDREYCIKGEFSANGHENTLTHEQGVISMARTDYTVYSLNLMEESYNSGGSQFFIMVEDYSSLDGLYAPFGKVIEGMEVIKSIENVEVYAISDDAEESTPVTDVIISKVTVETFGEDYGLPETLETWDFYEWVYETYGIDLYQQDKSTI